jgi:hypothetical protein
MKTGGAGKIWKDVNLTITADVSQIFYLTKRSVGSDFTFSRWCLPNFQKVFNVAISTRATTIARETLVKRGIKREDKAAIANVLKEVASDVWIRLRLGDEPEKNVKKLIEDGIKLPARDFIPYARRVLDAAESPKPIFDKIDWAIIAFFGGGVSWRGRLIPSLAQLSDSKASECAAFFGCKLSEHRYKKRRQRLGIPSLSTRFHKLRKNKTAGSVTLNVRPLGDNGS